MKDAIVIKRNRKRNANVSILDYIFYSWGGPTDLAETLTDILKTKVTPDRILLWRLRGEVALVWVERVGKALRVSPYLLNWRGYKQFTGVTPDWDELVNNCGRLSPAQKKDILKKKLQNNEQRNHKRREAVRNGTPYCLSE